MIIELSMESQYFYLGLIILASLLFVMWFLSDRKGGYGRPTVLNLKKGEGSRGAVVQVDRETPKEKEKMRDVTPQTPKLETPPSPPPPDPVCTFVYNGHDWDAYEVLGVSARSSFSDITKIYQQQIKKADPGKHEFLQAAYMSILKKF